MGEVVSSAYPAIRISGATKFYNVPKQGKRVAVESLSLEVPEGGIFGFLGANGAGKTTTIKMLLGFIEPNSGKLEIFGKSCSNHTTREFVGYLPEQPYFHPFLTPLEVLKVHSELLGLSRKVREEQIEWVIHLTNLEKNKNLQLSRLSKGNQQRVGIAQALLGKPRLLILDEPTSGLDPIGRHEMRQIIFKMREEGHTVFLSTHVLSEIENLCDRVGIMNTGRLVACGTPDSIKLGEECYKISAVRIDDETRSKLAHLGVRFDIEDDDVFFCPADRVFQAVRILEERDIPLSAITSASETLEAAFLRLAA